MNSSGNVGIGTTPGFLKLKVNGGITCIGSISAYDLSISQGILRFGQGDNRINWSATGFYREADGHVFNPNGGNGIILEHGEDESSGFYSDKDFAAIWSAGNGYLLKVIDEDGMTLKWYLDGNGVSYTISDKNRKENIKDIEGSLNILKKLRGVSYNFKLTEEEKKS